jgi:hypothetical protein
MSVLAIISKSILLGVLGVSLSIFFALSLFYIKDAKFFSLRLIIFSFVVGFIGGLVAGYEGTLLVCLPVAIKFLIQTFIRTYENTNRGWFIRIVWLKNTSYLNALQNQQAFQDINQDPRAKHAIQQLTRFPTSIEAIAPFKVLTLISKIVDKKREKILGYYKSGHRQEQEIKKILKKLTQIPSLKKGEKLDHTLPLGKVSVMRL